MIQDRMITIKNRKQKFYEVRIIVTKTDELFMYKIIICDDCSYRGPTNFAKTRLWSPYVVAYPKSTRLFEKEPAR